MRNLLRALLLAAGLAIALCLLAPQPVQATSPARLAAAETVARQVGHHGLHGPAPDRALVLGAWRDAGVDIRPLADPDSLLHQCQWLDTAAPRPQGPAPGDYALYRDLQGVERVGMFLSPVDVAIVDAGSVAVVPRPELSGDIGEAPVPRLLAQAGSFRPCRLPVRLWPGGVDDAAVGVGRIALADPGETAEHLTWAAAHPRDADQSFWRPVERIAASFAAGISGVLTQLLAGIFSGLHQLLERLGWVGAPFLAIAGLVGLSFDGRRLHAVLTAVVLAALALLVGGGAILPFGWIVVGAVLAGAAASHAGVPVLGAVGGALVGGAFAVASFVAGVLTGVDGSDRVSVGTVLFALVCDALWLRPALAALGVARHVETVQALSTAMDGVQGSQWVGHIAGEGRLLDVSGTVADAMALRPRAVMATVRALHDGVAARDAASVAQAAIHGAARHEAIAATEAWRELGGRSLDLASLAWRPSSISSDLVGHAADLLRLADAELRGGLPSMPGLRDALLAMDPVQRQVLLGALQHVSTHAAPQLAITARLSHLHSGARTLVNIATGRRPSAPWWQVWRSPVVQRVLRGLPESHAPA